MVLDREGTISVSDTGVFVIRTEQQMLSRLLWLGRNGRQLGVVGERDDYWNVALSPDNNWLTAVRHDFRTGQFNVWIASCANGLLEPLSDSNRASVAVWSRDSSTVYYTDSRREKWIGHKLSAGPEEVVMDLTRKRGAVLIEDVSLDGRVVIGELITDGAHSEIAWSNKNDRPQWNSIGAFGPVGLHARLHPDGRWLAFASFDTGRSEIYLMEFPSGLQRRRISNDGGHTPCWSRNGKELFFVAGDGGMMSLSLLAGTSLDTTAPKKLFQSNLRLGSDRPLYGVSGDGQRFLVIDGESTCKESDIDLVLHRPSLIVRVG